MPVRVWICYYDYNKIKNTCKWLLTTNEVYAKQTDQSYDLASYDDLMCWAAATNQVFDNCIITVIEGRCKWKEEEYIDFCGKTDWKCGYEIIWN
jgi:hypothetical protein